MNIRRSGNRVQLIVLLNTVRSDSKLEIVICEHQRRAPKPVAVYLINLSQFLHWPKFSNA